MISRKVKVPKENMLLQYSLRISEGEVTKSVTYDEDITNSMEQVYKNTENGSVLECSK